MNLIKNKEPLSTHPLCGDATCVDTQDASDFEPRALGMLKIIYMSLARESSDRRSG